MKRKALIISVTLLLILIWLARWRLYDLLELDIYLDQSMFEQFLPLICIVTISVVALAQPKAQSAKTESKPADSKEMEDIKETLKGMKEKLADLHAMSTIRKKKAGGKP